LNYAYRPFEHDEPDETKALFLEFSMTVWEFPKAFARKEWKMGSKNSEDGQLSERAILL
jgi:hypothetical protein